MSCAEILTVVSSQYLKHTKATNPLISFPACSPHPSSNKHAPVHSPGKHSPNHKLEVHAFHARIPKMQEARKRTYSHTVCTRTPAYMQNQTHKPTHKPSNICTHSHLPAYTDAHSLSQKNTHSLAHASIDTPTHFLYLSQTHTHAHI
jgi:hypothetical protein